MLQPHLYKDYCPNGLQLSGTQEIKKIVTGVTASLALIEQAVAAKADALLWHHGYFWKGETPVITGIKRQRLYALMQHDINLIAYHLPLDVHPEFGNNVQLAMKLNFATTQKISLAGNPDLLSIGTLAKEQSPAEFASFLQQNLQQTVQHLPGADKKISKIAWCTGAAQDLLETAAALNVDAYLSGEASERTFHLAAETGVDYFACGHHATERYGIQALGEHLAKEFNVEHQFIDIPNPVWF